MIAAARSKRPRIGISAGLTGYGDSIGLAFSRPVVRWVRFRSSCLRRGRRRGTGAPRRARWARAHGRARSRFDLVASGTESPSGRRRRRRPACARPPRRSAATPRGGIRASRGQRPLTTSRPAKTLPFAGNGSEFASRFAGEERHAFDAYAAGSPRGVTTHQRPPCSSTLWHLISPGASCS